MTFLRLFFLHVMCLSALWCIAPLRAQKAQLMLSSDFPQPAESAQFSEDGELLLMRSLGQYKLINLSAMREIPLPDVKKDVFDRLYLGQSNQLWRVGEMNREVYELSTGKKLHTIYTENFWWSSSRMKLLKNHNVVIESDFQLVEEVLGENKKRTNLEILDPIRQKVILTKDDLFDYFLEEENATILYVNSSALQYQYYDSLHYLNLIWSDSTVFHQPQLRVVGKEVFLLDDEVVVCYNIADGKVQWKKKIEFPLQSMVWTGQQSYIAGLSSDSLKWTLWDAKEEKAVFQWSAPKRIQQFSIAPNAEWIAFLLTDGSCAILDWKGNLLFNEEGDSIIQNVGDEKDNGENQLTWSPDSKWCWVQSIGWKYRIWNTERKDFKCIDWIQLNPFLENGKWSTDQFLVPIQQGKGLVQFDVKEGTSSSIVFQNFQNAIGKEQIAMSIPERTRPGSFTVTDRTTQDTVARLEESELAQVSLDPLKIVRSIEGESEVSMYYFTKHFLGKYIEGNKSLDTLFLSPLRIKDWFVTGDHFFLGITEDDKIFTFNEVDRLFHKAMDIPQEYELGKVEWNTLNQSWHLILNKEGDDPHLFLRKWCSIDRNGNCIRNVDLPRLVKSLGLIEFDWKSEKLFLGGDTIVEYSISNLHKPLNHYICPVENCNEIIWESPNHLVLCYPFQCDILDWDRKVVLDSLIDRIGTKSISDRYFRRFPKNNLWLGMTLKGRVEIYDKDSKKMDYIDDGGYWLSQSADHSLLMGVQAQQLNMIDVASRQIKYHLRIFENGDWLAYDDDYHYDGTPGAREQLYFTCGLEIIELAQLKDALYVPGLVEKIMSGQPIQYPKLSELEICGTLPLIEKVKDSLYHYTITPRKLGLKRVELYINGKRVMSKKREELKKVEEHYEWNIEEKEIEKFFVPGEENEVKVIGIVQQGNNEMQSRGVVEEVDIPETKKEHPNFYGLMVGVSDYKDDRLDLKYPTKDSKDVGKVMEAAAKKMLNTSTENHVKMYYVNSEVKGENGFTTPERAGVKKALESIAKEAKAEDVVMIFFAGHGVMEGDKDKRFTFLTAESTKENLVGISTKDLEQWMSGENGYLPNKTILIFDACNSGQATEELMAMARDDDETQRIRQVEDLKDKSGMFIMSASAANQSAYELPRYGHGLLTYSLLKTLKTSSSTLDEEKFINVQKWFLETETTMDNMTKELGIEQEAQPFGRGNIRVGELDEEIRGGIEIQQEKPMVFCANALNMETTEDDLHFKEFMNQGFSRSVEDPFHFIWGNHQQHDVEVNIIYQPVKEGYEVKVKWKRKGQTLDSMSFVDGDLQKIKEKILLETERVILQ